MRRLGLCIALLGTVAACDLGKDRPEFDGQTFRASLSKKGETKAHFSVSVKPVSASLQGAIEAGRFEATKFCVTNFGTSDVVWDVSPDQDPETLVIDNDTVTFVGVCDE